MADVLHEAGECGEYPFLHKQTKHYNLTHKGEILSRDKALDNLPITLTDPLVIIKAADRQKTCM